MTDLTSRLAGADLETDNPLLQLSIEELIKMGVEIRDELREESAKFKKFEASSKGMIARISMALKAKGDELKVNSFQTNEGTAYRNVKVSYRVGDWNQILPFIQENGHWQMLEKRVAKLATQEIHRATGVIPPGVEFVSEEEFVIRRPNERKGSNDD